MRRTPVLIGALFGSMQTGYFFQLSFAFSSSAITLFSVTLAWIAGVVCGLWIVRRVSLRRWQIGGLSVSSYLVCSALLAIFPLHDRLLPVYLLAVVVSGSYAGWFFATSADQFSGQTQKLFLWENNGFIVGLAVTTIAYIFAGRPTLWLLPIVLVIVSYPLHRARSISEQAEKLENPYETFA